MKQETTNFKF